MSEAISRARFLSRGAAGGLALVGAGGVLASVVGAGTAFGATDNDVAIAKVAATAELLAIDFYGRCISTGVFGGRRERYLRGARQNEIDHYQALASLIGPDAPKDLTFTYPAGTFATRTAAAKTGIALETAFIGAYLGAVGALSSDDLKTTAATIGANEQGHFIVFTDILTGLPVGPSFPGPPLTADQAVGALSGFLA